MTDVKGLKERLEAILVEESPMHPFGCAAWEEESREAIDSALAYIADLEAKLAVARLRADDLVRALAPDQGNGCSATFGLALRLQSALNTIGDEHG